MIFEILIFGLVFIVALNIGVNIERLRVGRILGLKPPAHSILERLRVLCLSQKVADNEYPSMDAQECLDFLEEYLVQGGVRNKPLGQDRKGNANAAVTVAILAYYSTFFADEVREGLKEFDSEIIRNYFEEKENIKNGRNEY